MQVDPLSPFLVLRKSCVRSCHAFLQMRIREPSRETPHFRSRRRGVSYPLRLSCGCATLKSGPLPSGVPVILEFCAEVTATEGDDGVSSADRPEHPRLFKPADNSFTTSFDHA